MLEMGEHNPDGFRAHMLQLAGRFRLEDLPEAEEEPIELPALGKIVDLILNPAQDNHIDRCRFLLLTRKRATDEVVRVRFVTNCDALEMRSAVEAIVNEFDYLTDAEK